MVEYFTTIVPENPARAVEAVGLLSRIFGEQEGLLEQEQLGGRETPYNADILFSAKEDGVLLGTCHLTIPHVFPQLGGASGLCTAPEARGKGIGKNLFRMMVEESDARGLHTVFLGTSNTLAAGMYAQFGYSFITGTNVMSRTFGKDLIEFYRTFYSPSAVTYLKGDASFRIPVIPLVAARGRDMLMDANTAIFSNAVITQQSCMGLYPRYLELERRGGAFYGARLTSGALCAIASMLPTPTGHRVDAFAYPGFESTLPGLLDMCHAADPDCYAQIASVDEAKAAMFATLGYRADEEADYPVNFFTVPCRIWRKTTTH